MSSKSSPKVRRSSGAGSGGGSGGTRSGERRRSSGGSGANLSAQSSPQNQSRARKSGGSGSNGASASKGVKARVANSNKIASASLNDMDEAASAPAVEAAPGEGGIDVEELVRRAALSGGSDETAGGDYDGTQTIFSPWQYDDANAATAGGAGESDELVEGQGDMEADRKSLLKRLRSAVGIDLTRIAIPVYYNEPTSFLHRMAEACQYYEYCSKAAAEEDAAMRLVYATVFAIVPYSSAERTLKPFNPILGETFEWTTKDARFVAEQVSHHPPKCACHMETADWVFEQYKEVKASFTGNAVVAPGGGETKLTLKKTGDCYFWPGLTSCVHNILVGRLWVDHYGKFKVENKNGKEYALVDFKQCGWFSRGWHEVKASIYDAAGKEVYVISGHWNDKLYLNRAGAADDAKTLIWEKDRRPAKDAHASFKGFSQHGQELNDLTPLRHETLIASDSRFRPDCRALARLNYKAAGKEKWKLEEKQRAERKQRNESDDQWQTRWFDPVPLDPDSAAAAASATNSAKKNKKKQSGEHPEDSSWKFNGKYWIEREKRLAEKGVEDPITPKTSDF